MFGCVLCMGCMGCWGLGVSVSPAFFVWGVCVWGAGCLVMVGVSEKDMCVFGVGGGRMFCQLVLCGVGGWLGFYIWDVGLRRVRKEPFFVYVWCVVDAGMFDHARLIVCMVLGYGVMVCEGCVYFPALFATQNWRPKIVTQKSVPTIRNRKTPPKKRYRKNVRKKPFLPKDVRSLPSDKKASTAPSPDDS